MDVPGSFELTRPGRGNFDLYEDGLAPQGWILSPEGGRGRSPVRAICRDLVFFIHIEHFISPQEDGLAPQKDGFLWSCDLFS